MRRHFYFYDSTNENTLFASNWCHVELRRDTTPIGPDEAKQLLEAAKEYLREGNDGQVE